MNINSDWVKYYLISIPKQIHVKYVLIHFYILNHLGIIIDLCYVKVIEYWGIYLIK